MSEEKICKDCIHCQHVKPSIFATFFLGKEEKYYCLRNLRLVENLDPVTGEIRIDTYGKVLCENERFSLSLYPEAYCGRKGRYWEPKK